MLQYGFIHFLYCTGSSSCTMDSIQKKSLVWTGLILAVVLVVWAVIFLAVLEDGVWANYEGSVGLCESVCENSHDCPADMAERPVVQQPINAWTSVCFLVSGFSGHFKKTRHWKRRLLPDQSLHLRFKLHVPCLCNRGLDCSGFWGRVCLYASHFLSSASCHLRISMG